MRDPRWDQIFIPGGKGGIPPPRAGSRHSHLGSWVGLPGSRLYPAWHFTWVRLRIGFTHYAKIYWQASNFEIHSHALYTDVSSIIYLSLCKLTTSCSCLLSCSTILSHSAFANWYCSNARASLSSAFCRASFSFSRSASALSRSVVSIALMAFV